MKTIDKYTDEEVAALSYEDVEKLKMLALATAGLKIPVYPTEPTLEDVVEPDLSMWTVVGANLNFRTKEAAEAVASSLVKNADSLCKSTYDYGLGYDSKYYYMKDEDSYTLDSLGTVQEKRVYSRELYQKIRETAQANKTLTDAYKAQLEEYKTQESEAKEVTAAVDERVREVEERFYKLRTLLERFTDYVTIADGDLAQAEKFFKAAYSPNDEDLAWVKAQYKERTTKATPSH